MAEDEAIIQQTRNWIRSFIVKFNICPFAKKELNRGSLRLQLARPEKIEQGLEELIMELALLDKQTSIETTLLIYPDLFRDFFHYLDFVNLAEHLLIESGYEGIYQLASFHPEYCFADVDFDDVSNYTNRSPYPMIHILREDSVEKAIAYYGNTDKIPEKNIATMHQLGKEAIEQILENCMNLD